MCGTVVGGRRIVVGDGERRIRGNRGARNGHGDAEHRSESRTHSVRRRSLTSAWRLSTSSTKKTPKHSVPAYNLPTAAEVGAAAAAEVAEAVATAEAAGVVATAAALEAALTPQ